VPTSTFNDPIASAPNGEGASEIKSRAAEFSQRAADVIDDKRDSFASGMESAASTLHARAEQLPGGERVARAAHAAAESLENASDYVRDQDLRGMLSDVGQLVKRNPGATLLTAAALGFLLAHSLSSSRD
jgi:ElaB/YqjD/DUF883 family membrane-anchored ribosome-binding protein